MPLKSICARAAGCAVPVAASRFMVNNVLTASAAVPAVIVTAPALDDLTLDFRPLPSRAFFGVVSAKAVISEAVASWLPTSFLAIKTTVP